MVDDGGGGGVISEGGGVDDGDWGGGGGDCGGSECGSGGGSGCRCSGDFRFLKYVNSISKNAHNTTFIITTYHHHHLHHHIQQQHNQTSKHSCPFIVNIVIDYSVVKTVEFVTRNIVGRVVDQKKHEKMSQTFDFLPSTLGPVE